MARVKKKTCPRCGQDLPVTEYYSYKRTSDGLTTYCKKCVSTASKNWHKANRDLHIERTRALRAAQPKEHRQRRHDNMERLRAMPANKGKCSVCIVECHKLCTGRRRGSICECTCRWTRAARRPSRTT